MAARYNERRDSQGRVRVELSSDLPAWLWTVPFVIPLALYVEEDWTPRWAITAGVIGFAALAGWSLFRRQTVRLLINPVARTLAVGVGTGARVVKMDDVERARVDEIEIEEDDEKVTIYRIELMLRSSEIVSLTTDHGRFDLEDCNRVVQRVNLALGQR